MRRKPRLPCLPGSGSSHDVECWDSPGVSLASLRASPSLLLCRPCDDHSHKLEPRQNKLPANQPAGVTPILDVSALHRSEITNRVQLNEAEALNLVAAFEWLEKGRLGDLLTVEFYRERKRVRSTTTGCRCDPFGVARRYRGRPNFES